MCGMQRNTYLLLEDKRWSPSRPMLLLLLNEDGGRKKKEDWLAGRSSRLDLLTITCAWLCLCVSVCRCVYMYMCVLVNNCALLYMSRNEEEECFVI